jgi:hypothetical protein
MYKSGVSPWALWRARPVERGKIMIPVAEIDPAV